MEMIVQPGEQNEIRLTLKGQAVERITIVYRNENDLPEMEQFAAERLEAWRKPLQKGGEIMAAKPNTKPEPEKTKKGVVVKNHKVYITDIPDKGKAKPKKK